jgi:hypothetical protein
MDYDVTDGSYWNDSEINPSDCDALYVAWVTSDVADAVTMTFRH